MRLEIGELMLDCLVPHGHAAARVHTESLPGRTNGCGSR